MSTVGDRQRYYRLTSDPTKNPTGVILLNRQDFVSEGQQTIYPFDQLNRGFSRFPSNLRPDLRYDKRNGRLPKDFESFEGYWLLSSAAKQVFESIDPDGFDFLECNFRTDIAGQPTTLWLCDVIRIVDALDETRSKVWILDQDRKRYGLSGANKLVFFPDKIGSSHIFRMEYSPNNIICDRSIRMACQMARIKETMLRDAVEKKRLTLEGTDP